MDYASQIAPPLQSPSGGFFLCGSATPAAARSRLQMPGKRRQLPKCKTFFISLRRMHGLSPCSPWHSSLPSAAAGQGSVATGSDLEPSRPAADSWTASPLLSCFGAPANAESMASGYQATGQAKSRVETYGKRVVENQSDQKRTTH